MCICIIVLLADLDFKAGFARLLSFSSGPPDEREVCYRAIADDVLECNEVFKLRLIVPDYFAYNMGVDIDPNSNEAIVTILDDDGMMN